MSKDILILGKGYIGTKLAQALSCELYESGIKSFEDADKIMRKFSPRTLINCIGFTGRNVDECEEKKEETLTANTFVPLLLAETALRNNAKLVHISSGCIFNFDYTHDLPITEDRIPDYFKLFYSRTKIYSERALEALSRQYPVLILRIRVPLDSQPHPKNLLTKLINYKKAIDVPNSVTYIPDFLRAAKHLIDKNATGIYNIAVKGGLRYPELLAAYKKYSPDFKYEVIDFKDLKLERTNLILSTIKLEESGFKVRDIKDVVEECVKEYIRY